MIFADKTGRKWSFDMTIGEAIRVKKESEGRFDLFEPSKPMGDNGEKSAAFQALQFDVVLFWELLAVCMSPALAAAGVTAEDFGIAMAADCLMSAQDAFFVEWSDFFRQLRRPDQAKALEKLTQYRAKAVAMLEARVAGTALDAFDKQTETRMEQALSKSFGDLLGTLDSTPDPTPSGS